MATIGSFKKVGNDYQGEIATLSLKAKGVRIVAESNLSNDKAPSHRVFVGRDVEIGAAWSKRSEEGRDYLSNAWWLATVPGLAISAVVLGANILGDGLRDWLDPRLKGRS